MRTHIECLIEKSTRRVPRGHRWQASSKCPVAWVQLKATGHVAGASSHGCVGRRKYLLKGNSYCAKCLWCVW